MRRKCFTLSVFLLFALTSYPQERNKGLLFVRNYPKTAYGFQPQNWAITQDKKGIMYFGNSDGVLQFDGTTWNITKMPNQTLVRSLFTDEKGKVYVGAQGEFGYLAPDPNGSMIYLLFKAKISDLIYNQGLEMKTRLRSLLII